MKKLLPSLLFLIIVGAGLFVALSPKEAVTGTTVGTKAQDFELQTLDGKLVKLSDYQGKKVLLNFWATWCPPCKVEIPEMIRFYEENQEDIEILAVNLDPKSDVKAFANDYSMNFPILLDEGSRVQRMYQVLTIPTSYFIDTNGVIQIKHTGPLSEGDMEKYTEKLN
ncbi:peroxiredoxin family protein [Bacillus salinus]|uniref:peroxiredoxin family protein n=1 Tax=Bacillus sp. HMF5848 TaxID=2495421 RepID=UPI00163A3DB5|nr:TlpA disulfide reductase family protein [Bacillus sp. HMF5848]